MASQGCQLILKPQSVLHKPFFFFTFNTSFCLWLLFFTKADAHCFIAAGSAQKVFFQCKINIGKPNIKFPLSGNTKTKRIILILFDRTNINI